MILSEKAFETSFLTMNKKNAICIQKKVPTINFDASLGMAACEKKSPGSAFTQEHSYT
jgi:hypothetical protein